MRYCNGSEIVVAGDHLYNGRTGVITDHWAGNVVVDAGAETVIPGFPKANVAVTFGNLMYNAGDLITTALDGTGLDGSSTTATLFLKASTANDIASTL